MIRKSDGSIVTGEAVREVLGLGASSRNGFALAEEEHPDFNIFVESTSYNRALLPGTILVVDTAAIEAKEEKKEKPSKRARGETAERTEAKEEEEEEEEEEKVKATEEPKEEKEAMNIETEEKNEPEKREEIQREGKGSSDLFRFHHG